MKKSLKILLLFFYFFIFCAFLKNSFSYMDPDFGWHIKMGEFISETSSVPWEEKYNYTLEGQNWVDHEWLLNYLSYKIFDLSGYITLNVLFALLGLSIVVILNYFLFIKSANNVSVFLLALIFEFLGFWGLMPHVGVRMQMFSVLMLLLLLIGIDFYSRQKNLKLLYFLPLFFLLWANLHAGFFLGIFIVWLWFFYMVFCLNNKTIFRKTIFLTEDFTKKEVYTFLGFALLSTLCTLITPYHVNYFWFILKYTNTAYMSYVLEWLPVWYAPINYYQLFYEVFFVAMFFVAFVEKKIKKINLWYLVLSVFLFLITIKARRNFPLFFVGSMPLMLLFIKELIFDSVSLKFDFVYSKVFVFFVGSCLFVSSAWLLLDTNFSNQPFKNEKFCQRYPCAQLEKIKSLPQKEWRVFNFYTWGGFFIWEWPENKLFIDGRLPMLPVNNHSLLEEYYEFAEAGRVQEKLDQYAIDLVVFGKDRETRYNWVERNLFGLKNKAVETSHLEKYLSTSSEWTLLYQDNLGYVYYR